MQLIYTILLYLIQPLIWFRLFYRGLKAPSYHKRWLERYGFCAGKVKPGGILIHSVSVGETLAAIPLIKKIQLQHPNIPITITTMTPTGSDRVKAAFADSVGHVYLPYDLPGAMQRFLNQLQPRLVIIMETEIWPNLIHQLYSRHIPVIIANARLSDRSARGYARLGNAMKNILNKVSLIAAQTKEDGQRFIELGLNPQHLAITGSLKYDIAISAQLSDKITELKQQWNCCRPVWIAASTHNGEDEIILNVLAKLHTQFPDLLLILVPRHPERFNVVEKLLQHRHLNYIRRSSGLAPTNTTQVILGDTMGELMLLYGLADIAFVGGSLIPHGGQNPLEPALHGLPIVMGPHLFNFKDICYKLEQSQCLSVVTDEQNMYQQLVSWLTSPQQRQHLGQQGAQVVRQNQGALEKLNQLIERYLE